MPGDSRASEGMREEGDVVGERGRGFDGCGDGSADESESMGGFGKRLESLQLEDTVMASEGDVGKIAKVIQDEGLTREEEGHECGFGDMIKKAEEVKSEKNLTDGERFVEANMTTEFGEAVAGLDTTDVEEANESLISSSPFEEKRDHALEEIVTDQERHVQEGGIIGRASALKRDEQHEGMLSTHSDMNEDTDEVFEEQDHSHTVLTAWRKGSHPPSDRADIDTQIIPRPGGLTSNDVDDETARLLLLVENSSSKAIEAMLKDISYADGPEIWVTDKRGIGHALGSEAKALRDHQRKSICELCKGISIDVLIQDTGYLHAEDWAALKKKAETCALCAVFARSVMPISQDEGVTDKRIKICIGMNWRLRKGAPHLEILVPEHGMESCQWNWIPLNTESGDLACRERIPPLYRIENTSSTKAMLLLKGWLDDCVENHHCQHLTKTPVMQVPWFHQLPARILDVSCFDDSEDVRLAETAFLDPKLPYIALSHVWGPNGIPDHTKLLKSNTTQFHKRIPYSCLAKNFQDAISITRQLKLRYIWVDALCIIQDSTQDWKTESMKMASVYMNALLTVAIEDSPDSEGGCFHTVDFSKSLPTMISIESTLSNGVTSTLIIPEEVDATVGGTVETGPPELQRSVLATRAWAYQERILSPRIIHFTNDTMIWECRTHYQGLWNILTRDTCNGNFSDCNRTNLLSRWYNEVVLEYSGRRLTHDKDKLPALAGLARLFHQLLGMPYHAGIWINGDDIGPALAWEPVCPELFDCTDSWRVYNSSGCPSWSWAGMAYGATYRHVGPIFRRCEGPLGRPRLLYYGCRMQISEHVDCDFFYKPEGEWLGNVYETLVDSFGAVKQAWLHIDGWVRHATLVNEGLAKGRRKLVDEHGVEIGRGFLNIIVRGKDDVVLLCLYDEGSFVVALILWELEEGNYVRVGMVHIRSETERMVEKWERRRIFLT